MRYVASSVDRSDVNHLLPGRVGKTSPRKTEQTQRNQDHPKRLVHGASVGGSLLFLEHLFNLAELLLDLACEFFGLAFGLQVRIVCNDTSILRLNGYGKSPSRGNSINLLLPLYGKVIGSSVQKCT